MTYRLTQDDFRSGYIVETADGRQVMHGTTWLGVDMTVPLDVPLCDTCDGEIEETRECPRCGTELDESGCAVGCLDAPYNELKRTGTGGWL